MPLFMRVRRTGHRPDLTAVAEHQAADLRRRVARGAPDTDEDDEGNICRGEN